VAARAQWRASHGLVVLALVVVVVIDVMLVWLPPGFCPAVPESTCRRLHGFSAGLRGHRHRLLVGAL